MRPIRRFDALCILIAYPSAIDQWAMRNPRKLLSMGVEASIIDTANPIVLQQHILCAAKEQPLTAADEAIFDAHGGRLYREAIASLHADREARRAAAVELALRRPRRAAVRAGQHPLDRPVARAGDHAQLPPPHAADGARGL